MSMKKQLSALLSLVVVAGVITAPITASAAKTQWTGYTVYWELSDDGKTLTISGTGKMPDFQSSNQPWNEKLGQNTTENNTIESVIIEDGVKSVGRAAFQGLSKLTNVTIPSSVTQINDQAFGKCSSLTSIEIPSTVTSIGSFTFWNCPNLKSVYVPADISSNLTVNTYAFQGSTNAVVYYDGTNENVINAFNSTAAKAVITQKEVVNPTSEDNKPAFVSDAGFETDGGATGFVSDITNNKDGEAQVINSITWAVTSNGETRSHTETYSEPMTISGDFYITFIVSGLYDPDATVVTTIN